MKRCCIVIGVNKTGDLPVLKASVLGAKDFATWASSQGIDVTLLTDEREPVSVGKVKASIHHYVQQRSYSQLILYFSGHGVLRSPDYELWLLSGAPDDPDEAVNVPGSIWLARNVGIPHIVVISDACRSIPNTPRLSQVYGGVIFPNETPKTPRPAVDVFYATLPGDPAFEVSVKEAAENYRGIFTDCLLKGLNGIVPEVVVQNCYSNLTDEQWVVPSWKLKPYLEEEVPNAAATVHIRLQQDPDIRVESHPPNYLAGFTHSSSTSPVALPASATNQIRFRHLLRSLQDDLYFQGISKHHSLPPNTREIATCSNLAGAINRLLDAKGRESFETNTGFTIIGTSVERALISRGSWSSGAIPGKVDAMDAGCDLFEENGAHQVCVPYNRFDPFQFKSRSALIQLQGGCVIPLAVLPGYVGTVVVEDGKVVTVTYLPSRDTPTYLDNRYHSDEIEKRRAFVAVAARVGLFRLEDSDERILSESYLRTLQSDPTLGLYLAYAFAQIGNLQAVKSVYENLLFKPVPALFDVAMLAKTLNSNQDLFNLSPFCPMLTQGWAYMDVINAMLPASLLYARGDLRPGLWTTFGKQGGEILWSSVEKGEIL